jgi:hypothetical protein
MSEPTQIPEDDVLGRFLKAHSDYIEASYEAIEIMEKLVKEDLADDIRDIELRSGWTVNLYMSLYEPGDTGDSDDNSIKVNIDMSFKTADGAHHHPKVNDRYVDSEHEYFPLWSYTLPQHTLETSRKIRANIVEFCKKHFSELPAEDMKKVANEVKNVQKEVR